MTKKTKRGFGQLMQRRAPKKNPSDPKEKPRYSGPVRAKYTHGGRVHLAPHSFDTRAAAEAWLAAEWRLISLDEWTPPAEREAAARAAAEAVEAARTAAVLTVGEYVERVIQRRERRARKPIAETTADLYRKDWKLRGGSLGGLPLAELDRARVGAWWDAMPAGTPTQNGRCYDLLKSVCAEAVEDGLLDAQPCRVRGAGKPAPKRSGEALSPAEVLRYLDAVPEGYRVALATAAWCGLRSGEVRGLRRQDVDLQAGVLRVRQGVTRVREDEHRYRWRIGRLKTDASRRDVAMPAVLRDALPTYLPPSRSGAGRPCSSPPGTAPR